MECFRNRLIKRRAFTQTMFLIHFIANGGSSSKAYGVLDFCVAKNC